MTEPRAKRQKRANTAPVEGLVRPEDEPRLLQWPVIDKGNHAASQLHTIPNHLLSIGNILVQHHESLQEEMKAQVAQFDRIEAKLNSLTALTEATSSPSQVDHGQNEASLSAELAQLKEKLAQLEEESTQKDVEIKKKEGEIRRKTGDLAQLRKALTEHGEKAMAQQHRMDRTQGSDNAAVQEALTTLTWAIRNLAGSSFSGAPLRKPVSSAQKQLFEDLFENEADCGRFMKDSNTKSMAVEAAIWNTLINRLLGFPLTVYSGTLNMEKVAISTLRANTRDYPYWRATTANLFEKHGEGPHENWEDDSESVCERQVLVDQLVDGLIKFHVREKKTELTRDIERIVEKAVDLACLMAQNRAFWAITMDSVKREGNRIPYDYNAHHRFGFTVDREYSQLGWAPSSNNLPGGKQAGQESVVDFVFRPLVLKWGDSSGRSYDKCDVMQKREVVATCKHA